MSLGGYSYGNTAVADSSTVKALPRTGNEFSIGFAGNTAYFSRAPEEDIEGQDPMYLVRFVLVIQLLFASAQCYFQDTVTCRS
jgi:hypothetical protein